MESWRLRPGFYLFVFFCALLDGLCDVRRTARSIIAPLRPLRGHRPPFWCAPRSI
mgnify:CR=1 FL=1